MGYLSKDAIFAADDVEFEDVDTPEWGEGAKVRIKSISGTQRDAYETSLVVERGGNRTLNTRNARAKLLVLCIVDEAGQRMFTDERDIHRLGAKNAKVVERIFDACRKLSGLSKEDVDSLTEDFDETRDDPSLTD